MSRWINSNQATPFSPTSYTGEEAFTRKRKLQEGMSYLSGAIERVKNPSPDVRLPRGRFLKAELALSIHGLMNFVEQVVQSVNQKLRPALQAPAWDHYPTLTDAGKEAFTSLWLSLSTEERQRMCPEGHWQTNLEGHPSHAIVLAATKGLLSALPDLLKVCLPIDDADGGVKVVSECLDLGCIEGAYFLLKNGLAWPADSALLSKTNGAGRNLAWIAAQKGDGPFLKELIARGANVDVPDEHRWTPLLVASNDGHLEAVQALARGHVNVDVMDVAGWMPLHRACFHGHREVAMTLLLEMGASADVPDHLGRTPLHRAVEHNHLELVKVLCRHAKVDPDHVGYVEGYALPVSSYQLAKDRQQTAILEFFDQYKEENFSN